MIRLPIILVVSCLIQPLAQACETGQQEMVQAGLEYRDHAAAMQAIEVDAQDAQAALDALMYDVDQTGGPDDWQAQADGNTLRLQPRTP